MINYKKGIEWKEKEEKFQAMSNALDSFSANLSDEVWANSIEEKIKAKPNSKVLLTELKTIIQNCEISPQQLKEAADNLKSKDTASDDLTAISSLGITVSDVNGKSSRII